MGDSRDEASTSEVVVEELWLMLFAGDTNNNGKQSFINRGSAISAGKPPSNGNLMVVQE